MRAALALFMLLLLTSPAEAGEAATNLLKAAIDHYRGEASWSVMTMRIVRPDWSREIKMEAWTRGESDSLVTITEPPRDSGSGTLKKGELMWTYNPKINRVIKIPPSMMSQSWMGSDFSNNDLARTDSILTDYTHEIDSSSDLGDGHSVVVLRLVPTPRAPVVWGMLKIKIRNDLVMLEEEYFDEDLKSVKIMTGSDIVNFDGRHFPKMWTMHKTGKPEEYTQIEYETIDFLDSLPERIFTQRALKEGRRR
ncbi:MAG: outer membrane lipoprotein-sorting protein [Pseudomonadota bacterium]|nr:outer membrane lipoprotein-sorting protein [Pseudomonadota bacterium]